MTAENLENPEGGGDKPLNYFVSFESDLLDPSLYIPNDVVLPVRENVSDVLQE
jgi:hypothetical protein